jgi:cytochrome c oxidase cbb3-type subunit I/II
MENWLDTVTAIIPYFKMRFLGILYLSGAILMVINVIKTVRAGSFQKKFLQKLLH